MGYYTQYDTSDNSDEVIAALEEVSGYDLGCFGAGKSDSIKWYECHKHGKVVSLRFPDTLITIHGEGEESGDVWTAYFKNGKMQYEKAHIVVDGFDESKLVD